ncbi:hypothetical protein ACHQM5_022979 [Ranunculus cassubicifolius]
MNASKLCFPTNSVHTQGVWLGDNNPLNYSYDLLLFQLCLISILSCILYVIFKPLRYPVVVPQILAGLILGPSFFCQNKDIMDLFFPIRGGVIFETIALYGFIYNQFLIGVRTDARIIIESGKRVVVTGMSGYFCPIFLSVLTSVYVKKYNIAIHGTAGDTGGLRIAVFTNSLSSSAVISNFLRDLNILNTDIGRLATSSAVISDACAMVLYAFYKVSTIARSKTKSGVRNIVGTIVSGAFMWSICLVMIWAAARWVIKRTPAGKPVKEAYIYCFILIILGSVLFSQVTGQGYVLVPFMVGLAVPDGPPLGSALEERLSSFVTMVQMPMFFTMCGLKTNIFSLDNSLWGVEIVCIACFLAKSVGVMVPNLYCNMPIRDAVLLALIMNSKGLVELSFYNTWLNWKVLSRKDFTALVLTLLVITVIVSHLVQVLYNPTMRYIPYRRRTIQHGKRMTELGILTCVHSEEDIPHIIHILDLSNPSKESKLHICVVHLVELVGRASSLLYAHKRPGKGASSSRPMQQSEGIVKAFRHYEESRQDILWVDIFTSVSPCVTMHDDLCSLALDKKASLIIIPFHKHYVADGVVDSSTTIRNLNCNVLEKAPCSVGILISRTHLTSSQSVLPRTDIFWVALLFLGGADDREALSYAMRMVEHHTVKLTLIKLTSKEEVSIDDGMKILDNEILNDFKSETLHNDRVWHKEEIIDDGQGVMNVIRSIKDGYDLVMVGRRHMESPLTTGLTEWMEHPELGTIGDILATSDFASLPYVLVVQQQTRVSGGVVQNIE